MALVPTSDLAPRSEKLEQRRIGQIGGQDTRDIDSIASNDPALNTSETRRQSWGSISPEKKPGRNPPRSQTKKVSMPRQCLN